MEHSSERSGEGGSDDHLQVQGTKHIPGPSSDVLTQPKGQTMSLECHCHFCFDMF